MTPPLPHLWEIETRANASGVFHLAPEGTRAPLCETGPAQRAKWYHADIRGDRLCANCGHLVSERMVAWIERELVKA